MSSVLSVRGLKKVFGGLVALNGFDLDVRSGEIVGLIGPNGAGKSTFFAATCGVYKPTEGSVHIDDKDVTGRKPYEIAQAGVVRTFQGINLFDGLSVLENALVGTQLKYPQGFLEALLPTRQNRELDERRHVLARESLRRLGLEEYIHSEVKSLPLGFQRIVGFAVALVAEPKFLLVDEPLAGLGPEDQEHVLGALRAMRDHGIGVVLVEHNVRSVMRTVERVVVLNFGEVIATGTPTEVQDDPRVQEAYLGAPKEPPAVDGRTSSAAGEAGDGNGA